MTEFKEAKSNLFEILGYQKSYWVKKKLVGNIKLDKPDREKLGIAGKQTEILENDLYLPDTRKTIKKGTEVVTELDVLYGRSKIKFFGLKQNSNQ